MTQLVNSIRSVSILGRYANWQYARRTRQQLQAMSLRELDDIGIARYQINEIR